MLQVARHLELALLSAFSQTLFTNTHMTHSGFGALALPEGMHGDAHTAMQAACTRRQGL